MRYKEILDSDEYKENISDPDRIECKQAMYSVINILSFHELAAADNPHNSDYFFWLDAGGSRFFGIYDLKKEYPSKDAVKSLDEMEKVFLFK